jgi:ribosomal protein S18 acetylase RimI-like enzyme
VTVTYYDRGIALLRAGEWFEAHEAFEDVWRQAEPAERDFFQGLVHVAVAWYQAGRRNAVGCERQLEKARRRLSPYVPVHGGLDLVGLLHSVDEARGRFPDLPPPLVADALPRGEQLARALAFIRKLSLDSAGHVDPFRFGTLVSDPMRPEIWDRNFVFLERTAADAEPGEIAAEVDRIQTGLRHRRAVVHDEVAAIRLAPGFRELGWSVSRYLVMVLEGEPPAPRHEVAALTDAELEPPLREFIRHEESPESKEVEDQLVSLHAPIRSVIEVRVFAHREAGAPVSWCELYSEGKTGQVEDVATLPEHRGLGYASSVVAAAARTSIAAGHDLTFLVVNEVDGPRALYERLGFVAVGREHAFFRPPPGAA